MRDTRVELHEHRDMTLPLAKVLGLLGLRGGGLFMSGHDGRGDSALRETELHGSSHHRRVPESTRIEAMAMAIANHD